MNTNWIAIVIAGLVGIGSIASADVGVPRNQASEILDRVLENQPTKDFSLKARLFVYRERVIPAEILVKNDGADIRTIYRAGDDRLLVVQPAAGDVRFYLRGRGELKGDQRMGRLAGSSFGYYDLGAPFLRWPEPKFIGEDRMRGRDCYVLESNAVGEPYTKVKMWIDREYYALLRAESFNENGDLAKRFAITSFKKIDEIWVPRGLEIAYLPPGQSLPSQEKSRLEIYEGDYNARLPADWFSSEKFGAEN